MTVVIYGIQNLESLFDSARNYSPNFVARENSHRSIWDHDRIAEDRFR